MLRASTLLSLFFATDSAGSIFGENSVWLRQQIIVTSLESGQSGQQEQPNCAKQPYLQYITLHKVTFALSATAAIVVCSAVNHWIHNPVIMISCDANEWLIGQMKYLRFPSFPNISFLPVSTKRVGANIEAGKQSKRPLI